MAFALGLLVWSITVPCAAEVVRLNELEKRALESSTLTATNTARVQSAASETRKAESAYYPRIDFKAESTAQPGRQLIEYTDENGEKYLIQGTRKIGMEDAFAPQIRHGADLNVTASLYNFGRTAAGVAAGRAGSASAAADGEADRAALVEAVRASYLSWLTAHELLQIAERALHDAERHTARVAALIAQGARPDGELLPVRAEELLSRIEHQRASSDLARAKLDVERVVGSTLSVGAQPDTELLRAEQTPTSGAQQDAKLHALERQYEAARALAHVQETLKRPDLATGLQAGVRAQGVRAQGFDIFPLYGVGVSLSVPLWDGGLSSASAAAARARASAIKAQMQSRERERDAERAQAELDAKSASERLAIVEELRALSEQRLTNAEKGYELGVVSFDQVGQARAMLRRAHTEELLARVERAGALLQLAPSAAH